VEDEIVGSVRDALVWCFLSAHLEVLWMKEETRRRLERVKDLLKGSYTVKRALGKVGLGWKSCYKYGGYIYSDGAVPPLWKKFPAIKFGPYEIEWATSRILRDIAKREAQELVIRKHLLI